MNVFDSSNVTSNVEENMTLQFLKIVKLYVWKKKIHKSSRIFIKLFFITLSTCINLPDSQHASEFVKLRMCMFDKGILKSFSDQQPGVQYVGKVILVLSDDAQCSQNPTPRSSLHLPLRLCNLTFKWENHILSMTAVIASTSQLRACRPFRGRQTICN